MFNRYFHLCPFKIQKFWPYNYIYRDLCHLNVNDEPSVRKSFSFPSSSSRFISHSDLFYGSTTADIFLPPFSSLLSAIRDAFLPLQQMMQIPFQNFPFPTTPALPPGVQGPPPAAPSSPYSSTGAVSGASSEEKPDMVGSDGKTPNKGVKAAQNMTPEEIKRPESD